VYFICPEKGVEVFVTYDPKMWGTLNDKDANPKRWSIFKGPGETKDDVILRVCGSMEYYAKICAVWSGGGGGGGGHVSIKEEARDERVLSDACGGRRQRLKGVAKAISPLDRGILPVGRRGVSRKGAGGEGMGEETHGRAGEHGDGPL